ncbi:transposase [Streptomyces albidoflavus]|uniref:transposase n=1 Tax=Streptomyces albidoflavus TaxID=1886 RepID=UPI003F4C240B
MTVGLVARWSVRGEGELSTVCRLGRTVLADRAVVAGPGTEAGAGRPRVPDLHALCGILFVLHTGIQWEYLPQELGFGSGMMCWRRLAA